MKTYAIERLTLTPRGWAVAFVAETRDGQVGTAAEARKFNTAPDAECRIDTLGLDRAWHRVARVGRDSPHGRQAP